MHTYIVNVSRPWWYSSHSSLRVGGAGNLSGKAFNKFYKRSTCSFSGPFDGDKNIITTFCGAHARVGTKPNKRNTRKWLIADNNLRRSISHHLKMGWRQNGLIELTPKTFYMTLPAQLQHTYSSASLVPFRPAICLIFSVYTSSTTNTHNRNQCMRLVNVNIEYYEENV